MRGPPCGPRRIPAVLKTPPTARRVALRRTDHAQEALMEFDRRDFIKTAGATVAAAMTADLTAGTAAAQPVHEIYAAKYAGPFTSKLAFLMFNKGWDETIDRFYYVWVVKGGSDVTIVDTGVGVTTAADKKLTGFVNPVDVVKRVGADASNVTKVVITHMHWDHVGGMEMFPKAFPKATFYVQKKEYDFWTKHPVAKRPFMQTFADPRANAAVSELEG